MGLTSEEPTPFERSRVIAGVEDGEELAKHEDGILDQPVNKLGQLVIQSMGLTGAPTQSWFG